MHASSPTSQGILVLVQVQGVYSTVYICSAGTGYPNARLMGKEVGTEDVGQVGGTGNMGNMGSMVKIWGNEKKERQEV